MEINPKTFEEALDLVREILIQGDTRYNDIEREITLAQFILYKAISLEETEFPSNFFRRNRISKDN